MEEKKEISLEEIMDRLDDTVTQMENDKMTLEESYQAFSEGMKLVKMGNDAIDRVEKKIKLHVLVDAVRLSTLKKLMIIVRTTG